MNKFSNIFFGATIVALLFAFKSDSWSPRLIIEEDTTVEYIFKVDNTVYDQQFFTGEVKSTLSMLFEIDLNLSVLENKNISTKLTVDHIVVEQNMGSMSSIYDSYIDDTTGVSGVLSKELKPVLSSEATGELNSYGVFVEKPASTDPTGSLENALSGLFFDFPKRDEIKVGDRWKVVRGGVATNTLELELIELKSKTAKVHYNFTLLDSSQVKTVIEVNTQGQIEFSTETGLVEKYNETQEYKTFSNKALLGSIQTKIEKVEP